MEPRPRLVGIHYRITERGRVFLDILDRLALESRSGRLTPELTYLLTRLRLDPAEVMLFAGTNVDADRDVEELFPPIDVLLMMMMIAAHDVPRWDLGRGAWMKVER